MDGHSVDIGSSTSLATVVAARLPEGEEGALQQIFGPRVTPGESVEESEQRRPLPQEQGLRGSFLTRGDAE